MNGGRGSRGGEGIVRTEEITFRQVMRRIIPIRGGHLPGTVAVDAPLSIGFPRPSLAGSRPLNCVQMSADRIHKKFIGAVEDEWQLYRSAHTLRLKSTVPVLTRF